MAESQVGSDGIGTGYINKIRVKKDEPTDEVLSDGAPLRRVLLRQERSRLTRQRLIRVAVALWEEKGYDETTVEDIAAAAEVSWSTFYFHFPRKEALLVELAGGAAEGVARDMKKVSLKSSLEEALEIFTNGVCRRALRIPRPVLAMVAAANISHIGKLGGNTEYPVHFGTTLEPWLERAQITGEIASDADIKELSAIFVSMTMEAMLRWAMSNTSQQDLAEVFRLRRQIFLHGLQIP